MIFSKDHLHDILGSEEYGPAAKSLARCCLKSYNLLEMESGDITKVLYNYLIAKGEKCEIVRMCGNIFLCFSKGFRDKNIKNKLKPFFEPDTETILMYPIPIAKLIEIGDTLYGLSNTCLSK